jgi:hypothetical protein
LHIMHSTDSAHCVLKRDAVTSMQHRRLWLLLDQLVEVVFGGKHDQGCSRLFLASVFCSPHGLCPVRVDAFEVPVDQV